MDDHLFLTGGTGFLGGVLARRLIAQPGVKLYLLVRARDEAHLQTRKREIWKKFGLAEHAPNIAFVWGDITQPRFGLSEYAYAAAFESVNGIIHAAASTRFDLTKEEATQFNIVGGRQVVDLAWELQEQNRLKRLDYVSTCYVGGDRQGRFYEWEGDVGQQFRNTYEWSKCMGETHLRNEIDRGLKASIHRPSIIVGDSTSGAAEAFTAFYLPIKVYARGWWRTLPGQPNTGIDLIPVDYTADAILRLRSIEETVGHCFHIAAGDEAITIDDIVSRLDQFINAPPVRYFDPNLWRRYAHPIVAPFLSLTNRGRKVRNVIESFLPYFSGNPLFDTEMRDRFLPEFKPPSALDFFEKIMRYALERDFQ